MKTAILVDGGFFLKRYPKVFRNGITHTPEQKATNMYRMALQHLTQKRGKSTKTYDLYRILYYDCMPFDGNAHNPITGKHVNFSQTPQAQERLEFFNHLKKKRKVALRLGQLKASKSWVIKPHKTKTLLSKKINIEDLTENDVSYELRQKGVDMKIGLDISSLSIKKMVDQIILIAGDSDFVPAAKTARREGVDFILDPMWNPIHPNLHEHIDGLRSTTPNPAKAHPTQYPYIV